MIEISEATRTFISQHAKDDVRQLALRHAGTAGVDMSFALQQIAGRQQARWKLPTWAATDRIVYPPHLSMEQCSSEQTARYKATVAERLLPHPDLLVDLTGGFGVDFSFMAPLFRRAVYVEQNASLCAISSMNLPILINTETDGQTVDCVCDEASHYLSSTTEHASLIFLDPARRDEHGGRTFAISDCTPDVLALRDLLLQRADYVMLKLSPMLDWRKAVSDLGPEHVCEVHIVSVHNECKELLVVMSPSRGSHFPPSEQERKLICVNDDTIYSLPLAPSGERAESGKQASPLEGNRRLFLYEPNASIMKAGCFEELTVRFGVGQLATNSHLFTADHLVPDFPGRKFQILSISSLNKRDLKEKLGGLKQANLTVRNFPMTVAELRRRLKLGDGGSHYLFATTLADGSHVIVLTIRIN